MARIIPGESNLGDKPYVVSQSKIKGSDEICTKVKGQFYTASKEVWEELGQCAQPTQYLGELNCIIVPFLLIDLAFSFAVDTIIFPYTVIKNNTYNSVFRDGGGKSCIIAEN